MKLQIAMKLKDMQEILSIGVLKELNDKIFVKEEYLSVPQGMEIIE